MTIDGPAMVGLYGTEAKPNVGKQCVFPFKVNGVEYHSCTTTYQEEHRDSCSAFEDHADVRPICSTLVDKEGYHVAVHPSSPQNWGYCGDECPLSKHIIFPLYWLAFKDIAMDYGSMGLD